MNVVVAKPMTCVCGKPVTVDELYQHLMRDDHRSSPAQWGEAYKRIEAGREKAKAAARKKEDF
jgi:hypothetical protein